MKLFSITSIIVLLTLFLGWLSNQPKEVGDDVPQGKLNSLSFAPFWDGQGPMDEIFPNVAQIDSDLRLLSDKTHSIRTYASAEGTMPEIPALARKYGLTVIQGAWLGGIKKSNQLEIDGLVKSANANPDVVKRVIVGNEVLLRGDLGIDELIQYIRTVKQFVKQPVSYADVWSKYMQYPQLIKEVDFITIHILPYWEDEPISVNEAPSHIERIFKRVRQEADRVAPGKAILIGESGWPSEGRQRGWAIPNVTNEAKFIRGLIKVATTNNFDYNIVEAINQGWKSELEGVVGANWGLFSAQREAVFPLIGMVYENPRWYRTWIAAVAILVVIVVILHRSLRQLPTSKLFGFLIIVEMITLLWTHQTALFWYTSYSVLQQISVIALAGLSAILAGIWVLKIYAQLGKHKRDKMTEIWFYRLYLFFATYVGFQSFCLAFNGRYISFPNITADILVLGVLAFIFIRFMMTRMWSVQVIDETIDQYFRVNWLGYTLLIGALGVVVGETAAFVQSGDLILAYPSFGKRLALSLSFTLINWQLLQWVINAVIIAVPLLKKVK